MLNKTYSRSSKWQKNRLRRLEFDEFQCQGIVIRNGKPARCGNKIKVDVHHRSYERIGYERLDDMITLCRRCHVAEHQRMKHCHEKQLNIEFLERHENKITTKMD